MAGKRGTFRLNLNRSSRRFDDSRNALHVAEMRRLTQLFEELDASTKTTAKVAALRRYFDDAPAADAAWALWFLSGGRFKNLVKSRSLRQWATDLSGQPAWLVEESYAVVGDMAETFALLIEKKGEGTDLPLHTVIESQVLPLRDWDDSVKFQLLRPFWTELDAAQRFVFIKLITGGLRVGVSRTLVVRALAQVANVEPAIMEHRLMGPWEPAAEVFESFIKWDDGSFSPARPYPFYLASSVNAPEEELGELEAWQVENKWDGIRAQLICRGGEVLLWSRGEEMLTERFPEITQAAANLPQGTVLDGEVMAWRGDYPLPFASLQTRIGRKKLSEEVLREAPAAFIGYDCLEQDGTDIREKPLEERREILESLLRAQPADSALRTSPLEEAMSWDELKQRWETSRERLVEGFMFKRKGSPYRVGRVKGDWWKWKIDPLTVDAVMIYAQTGHGRRANLYTDYTFGVWDGENLVPVAKAYSGLTDAEIRKVDAWVKRNSLSKHGPVRIVKPELVFELAFEGIAESTRHKSGLALRFPRISRWRTDKPPREADQLSSLQKLLKVDQTGNT